MAGVCVFAQAGWDSRRPSGAAGIVRPCFQRCAALHAGLSSYRPFQGGEWSFCGSVLSVAVNPTNPRRMQKGRASRFLEFEACYR